MGSGSINFRVWLVMVNVVLPCFCEEGSIDCSKIVQGALQATGLIDVSVDSWTTSLYNR